MNDLDFKELIEQLQQWGVVFDTGLSSNEIRDIESEGDFHFPNDLKAFLQFALPVWEPNFEDELYVCESFPNWRTRGALIVRKSQRWLLRGILDHVKPAYDFKVQEYGPRGTWLETWGSQPSTWEEARAIVEAEFAQAPILIPVYAHRFIPTEPATAGNPIFSIMATDIIHYGPNLGAYLVKEFGRREPDWAGSTSPYIRFWDDFRKPLSQPPSRPVNPNDLGSVDLTEHENA